MRIINSRYKLEREIGRGASGSVWVAHDDQLQRRVALKLLHPDVLDHTVSHAPLEREARMIAQLRSPHIVQVYDAGVDARQPFIVMELLEGESLDMRLHRHPRLPLPIVASIVSEVARALTLTHRAGIIHRDLKPANVFLAREPGREVSKLLDFGVATFLNGAMTKDGEPLGHSGPAGTPQYMSPEQLSGAPVDASADLWSLAVLAYQMLTGRWPFAGDTVWALRANVCAGAFTPPSSILSELGTGIDAFFARALARQPSDRFQSASELASELLRLADRRSSSAVHVLIVDDEPDMELLVRQIFRRQAREGRYELHFARDGYEALDVLRRHREIDVVLTDIAMPAMDGLTLLARIPEVNPVVRVVVVSAYGDLTNIRTAMNRGAFDFLCKPIDFADLECTIDKCARQVADLRNALLSREENDIMRGLLGAGVVERLLTSLRVGEQIQDEAFDGTIVFVRVYGFADVLRDEQPEVCFRHLNAHFDLCVPELLARSGRITRFFGDSVAAVFAGDAHLPRAVDACLAIRERIRPLDVTESRSALSRLGAAIGLDSGRLKAGGVGSLAFGRLEHTLLGEAVTSAAQLHRLANRHEVLTTQRVWKLIAADYVCELDSLRKLKPNSTDAHVVRIVGRARTARSQEAPTLAVGLASDGEPRSACDE